MKNYKPTVVLDFDGVIHSYRQGWKGAGVIPDPVVPGIADAIDQLRESGYMVVVVSTRCSTHEGMEAVKNYLTENSIVVDDVLAEKPLAVCYIDDRAICFDGHPETLPYKVKVFKTWLQKEPQSQTIVVDQESEELNQFRELTKLIPFERLKELAAADARGMVLLATIPIGTTVYQLSKGEQEEIRIIDGEKYTRKVPNWYVTRHNYSWVDAMVYAENPEQANHPHCRYYFTREDAFAECDRINAGGDPCATGGSVGESAGAYADMPTLMQPLA